MAWASVPFSGFRYTAKQPLRYASSTQVTRAFCGDCGAQLTFAHDDYRGERIDIATATLDDPVRRPAAGPDLRPKPPSLDDEPGRPARTRPGLQPDVRTVRPMVQLNLPKNSRIAKGRHHAAPAGAKKIKSFRIYRWDPEGTGNPQWDTYEVDVAACGPMVLDALIHIKNTMDSDPGLPPLLPGGRLRLLLDEHRRAQHAGLHPRLGRRSRQGRPDQPLPHLPVIKDLVPDLTIFYAQYASIEPWLHTSTPEPAERMAPVRGRPGEARRPLRVHPLRLLLHLVPQLLVERREVPWARPPCCRPAAGWSTAATRPPASGSTTSRTRSSSTAATPS